MKCTKCGNELRKLENKEGYYICDRCNLYFKTRSKSENTAPHNTSTENRYSFVKDPQPAASQSGSMGHTPNAAHTGGPAKIRCPMCGGTDVDISFVQTGASTVTRNPGAPTKVGRKAMKASTFGLWGLTGKRTGYSSTAFYNQKMALCKDCGHSWAFFTEREKNRNKSLVTGILITAVCLIFFLTFWSCGSTTDEKDTPAPSYQTENKAPVEESDQAENKILVDESERGIEDFEYEISDGQLKLLDYNGSNESLTIAADYKIQDVNYKTDLTDFQLGGGVKTLIISEGISELYEAMFNMSDVEKVYLPSSLTVITDNTLSYLHGDELTEIYYGGSEEQWNSIFKHYVSPGVTESWKAEDYEAAGTAIADRINKMVGLEYDPSKFNFHYNSSPDELNQ
ncbi:Uncharacterised protein [[Eubacterium] contortum]|uniref:Uncharacterized protein n=1 Tax=Faecalicatena contorta TaxID=39482 RepID=A0A174FV15_9FIRM|nr:hypothetical protein [Faecalicatena contorta]CUO53317.1 Uncharacterised protein [[Eubacterium] contortum] [Faecalicatena contorta]